MMTLDEAIKYHEEMSRERYLNDGSHKQYAEWLKELKQFRQQSEEDYSYHTGYTQRKRV